MKAGICQLLLLPIFLFFSRKKEEPARLAVVSTTLVTNITTITATSGGRIASDGGALIKASGVCWGTAANPSTVTESATNISTTGATLNYNNCIGRGRDINFPPKADSIPCRNSLFQ